MGRYEVRLSGAGGQGLILGGIILAEGFILEGGYHVVQTQSYGPEARGGASKSEVIISDTPIHFPKISSPDLILALTQKAFDKYIKDIKDDGIVIVDEEVEVKNIPATVKVYSLPILHSASEKIGKSFVANIISLGIICGCIEFLDQNKLKEAILSRVPKGTQELNSSAFELGLQLQKECQI